MGIFELKLGPPINFVMCSTNLQKSKDVQHRSAQVKELKLSRVSKESGHFTRQCSKAFSKKTEIISVKV